MDLSCSSSTTIPNGSFPIILYLQKQRQIATWRSLVTGNDINWPYRSPSWFSTKFVQILVNPSDFHQFWWHFCRIFCGFIEIFTVFGDWFSLNFAAIFQSIYVHQFWWFFSWIFWWIIDNFTGIGELFITSTVTCLPD